MSSMLTSLAYEPRVDESDETPPRLTWWRVALEDEILSVLDAAPRPGERIESAFRRKECELTAVFGRLSVPDARALRRRLTLLLPDDPITARVMRLIPERRARLVRFLGDARRREAVRSARRA